MPVPENLTLRAIGRKFVPSFHPDRDDPATDAPTASGTDHELAPGAPQKDPKLPNEVVAASSSSSEQAPDETAQDGVTQAEAITLTWTKNSLALAYILMWFIYMVNAFQSQITSNLSAYITSDFEAHSLLAAIDVVTTAMSAACYMPIAKILNIWDRSVGFAIMTLFCILGLIMCATCHDIATYCAAQVFYNIGFAGIIFCVDVITADTSTLRDRGLAYGFTSSPYIITAFAGPAAAEHFEAFNWRWGYGCFCIILPVFAAPLFFLLRHNKSLAQQRGLLKPKVKSDRTFMQSIWHYTVEFDVLGTFLLAAGLVLFLLPFTIAASAADGWRQGYIIAMLVIGIACLLAFFAVEKYWARVPFLPWHLLASRTVLGACLVDATYQISYYCWDDYWTSYLQVVFGTSIATAGYIANIFDVVSGVWLFGVGFLIKGTGRFRWLLIWSVPLYLLGIGLMIYFRQPGSGLGYNIMCQIFIAFAGGTMIITQQVAVMSQAEHQNVASSLAFLNTFGNMGSSVGSSISGAIWTHSLASGLKKYLPASALPDWEDIYDNLETQLSYPTDGDVHAGIVKAYASAQTKMLIAGTCIMSLSLIWVFIIRDVKLNNKQTKGVLF